MKNSVNNSENTSVATTVKSVAVDTVKIIVYPAHLVCQTAADLLNIGQAKAINLIDGTEMFESMMNQTTWTQDQQAKVVNQYLKIEERINKQRDYNKQQDVDKFQKALDKAKGVEHMTNTEPTSVVSNTNTEPTSVPAPPVDAPFVPINKRKAVQNTEVPLMSPQAVFAQ